MLLLTAIGSCFMASWKSCPPSRNRPGFVELMNGGGGGGGGAVVLVVNGRRCLSAFKAVNVEEKREAKLTGVVLPSVVLVAFRRVSNVAVVVLVVPTLLITAAVAPDAVAAVVVVAALDAALMGVGVVAVGVALLRLGIVVVRLAATTVVALATVASVAGTAAMLKLQASLDSLWRSSQLW